MNCMTLLDLMQTEVSSLKERQLNLVRMNRTFKQALADREQEIEENDVWKHRLEEEITVTHQLEK